MKIRHVLTIVTVLLIFIWIGSSLAQQTMTPQASPQHMFGPPLPPATACTDGKHLYVILGPKIYQYTVPDLKLHNTVELPLPAPPTQRQ
jgi:hypothetical protein